MYIVFLGDGILHV